MRLSIIIPVYKVEDWVGACLRSVLSSTHDDYEVIVVNDGTPDDSMVVAKSVIENDPRVRILEQDNSGLSAARMAGLALSQGEYVWFIDSDDFLDKGAIDIIFEALRCEDPDVLALPLHWTWPGGSKDYDDIVIDAPVHLDGKTWLREGRYVVCACQRYIFRRSIANPAWVFFPTQLLHEDEYFARVMLYNAQKICIWAQPLYRYRQREKSIMSANSIRSSYDIVSIYRLLKHFCNEVVAPEDRSWFSCRCVEVLSLSYAHNANRIGSKEFSNFLRINKRFIIKEYLSCASGRSLKTLIGDIYFLAAPKWYLQRHPLRYISFGNL
jgi:glycosyltransferase involved in cell wall biosynthesis